MNFRGKVVLITGASSGIGAATAKYFASLGAALSLTGRNHNNLTKVASECQPPPNTPIPHVIEADLTNEKQTKDVITSTIQRFGKLDVLVNCAGIMKKVNIENATLEKYDMMMNINVRSMYHLTALATPHLIQSKGNIVNVSSVAGLRAIAGNLVYCMSKAAVDQFTRCVALDLAPKQVRVNSVNPGVITTNLHIRGGMSEEEYQQYLERSKITHALGRNGEPIEVAKTIAFLASNHASFITGASIPVDGGRHIMGPR